MKLQAKLRVYAFTAIGVILIAGAMLLLVGQQIRLSFSKKQTVRAILENNVKRNTLIAQYLADPQANITNQWNTVVQSLTALLAAYPTQTAEEKSIITTMAQDSQRLKDAFWEANASKNADSTTAASVRIERVNNFSASRQSLAEQSLNLSELNENALWTNFQKARFFIIVLIVLLTLLMLGIIYLINKNIGGPLKKLTTAARQISEGTLDADINPELLEFQDEVGDLSRAFQQMVNTLKESHANLEQKVKEKTSQLDAKVDELERTTKLMVGRELKMIELKKEIEKLTADKKSAG